ncbi:DinB family protein [Mycolicibacterium alvei]|uniref:DNA damage-inducible protein DinB n=1 Tax=Mycolicibacterium alvei TaxID=67081 RepID=A0A6N4UPA2_9MYCO|nr:DinB family protein [Mycolicibacterium alvei]MCV6999351.1 DinB family protein [Mycolicibacterium alvei]BBX25252.1 DNA damage-inducible protein DinB [Mycolicibacterium alvei]
MIALLRNQFDLAWALTDLHLSVLADDDHLWEPGPLVWTVHEDASGRWWPDFADIEPDPIPVPTIGWLTWHMIFWWSTALAHVEGRPPPPRSEIDWPGPAAAVQQIGALSARWSRLLESLTDADLLVPSAFPWGPNSGRSLADTVLWLNVELTKNAAEIGQLRLLRSALLTSS